MDHCACVGEACYQDQKVHLFLREPAVFAPETETAAILMRSLAQCASIINGNSRTEKHAAAEENAADYYSSWLPDTAIWQGICDA